MLRKNTCLIMAALILTQAFITGGCKPDQVYIAAEKMSLSAETSGEGIVLLFENIPPGTSRIFVDITDWSEMEEISGANDIVSRFANITDSSLDFVKAGGKVVCPFVKSGENYFVSVFYETEDALVSTDDNWLFAECAAGGGIYFDSGLELALDEEKSSVRLSAEPVFSSWLRYPEDKYRYGITIKKSGYWSIGIGGSTKGQGLSWEFEPQLTNEITESGYLESGNYPAYATVYCNAVYDGLTWAVELAKSREFSVSFQIP